MQAVALFRAYYYQLTGMLANLSENKETYTYISGFLFLLFYCVVHVIVPYLNKKKLQKQIDNKLIAANQYKNKLKRFLKERSQSQQERHEKILDLPIQDLLGALRREELKAKEVLQAYQFKALEAHEKTNCITEFITEAEARAEELDQDVGIKQPLHGLPISVKDNIYVKGYDCTLGLAKFINKPVDEDAQIVEVLKHAGAIPFVKTNVPQTLLSFNCCNPIFGITNNPLSTPRTTGGSSGGECALIALGGSIIGLGSDIGGSLRIPSHMCGVCCLKPTYNRISVKNVRKSMEGITGVLGTPGPISKTVDGLYVIMQTLLSPKMFSLDPEVIPIPFNEKLYHSTSPLRIGYYESDGLITPTPGCARAVREAIAVLEGMGHELIRFEVPRPWDAYQITTSLLLADGGRRLKQRWSNEIVETTSKANQLLLSFPRWLRKLISKMVSLVSPLSSVMAAETGRSADELWMLSVKRQEYLKDFLCHWNNSKLDALIAPGFSVPAPPHAVPPRISPAAFTTMLFNFLNLPAGTLPFTNETEEDQNQLKTYRTDDLVFRLMKQATVGANGLPIGIQVVSLPWKEEIVLRIMKSLEKT